MHRDEWDNEDEEPASAAAPLTTKEKDLLRYYYYIHNGIDTRFALSLFCQCCVQRPILSMFRCMIFSNEKYIYYAVIRNFLFTRRLSLII
jgi:hypothetical protein